MTVTSIQVCGNSAPPSYSTTVARYQTIFGDIGAATTEANAQYKVNDTLTAKNLLAQVATNAVTAATTLSTRKNGATGNLTVSITALTTGAFEDTTNSDSLVVGDQFNYTFTLGSANSLGISIISVTFDHNASATVFLGTINDTGSSTLANAVIFWPINGDFGGSPTTEANAQFKTE